jgi:D-alanyl-D-alanine carboxypeptidase
MEPQRSQQSATTSVPTTNGSSGSTTTTARDAGIATVQAAIDAIVLDSPTLHGVVVHVIASDLGVDESIASGENVDGPISPDATFRLASVTKTFTAAAVLRLVEQGKVDLEGPISQCVAPDLAAAIEADGYDLDVITVRQALSHTAGFFDFAQDPAYVDAVFGDPSHLWSALEQVQWAVAHGDPLGPPGENFSYDNTGYVLLGSLIECATGLPLAQAFRELLHFEQLGLDATYVESLEPVPPDAGPRAHQFFGEIDTFAFDPSMNLFGDGGLVSSAADIARFSHALLEGEVFDQVATLEAMLEPPENGPETAGLGIFRDQINGTTCWSHQGLWGTAFFTCPDINLSIGVSVQQGLLDDVDLNPILLASFALAGH